MRRLTTLCLLFACAVTVPAAEPVPLLFSSDGETLTSDGKLKDLGPLGYDGEMKNATLVPGRIGKAVAGGADAGFTVEGDLLKNIGLAFTATAWVRIDTLPRKNQQWLIGKGANAGLQIGLVEDGRLWFHGSWGGGWYHGPWTQSGPPLATWAHVAGVFAKGGTSVIYLDGKPALTTSTPYAIQPIVDAFQFGRCDWRGAIDDPRIYAAALTAEQVAADRDGTLSTRAATAADVPLPPWPVRVRLGRFDRPNPNTGYVFAGHEAAVRVGPPNAVDWPRLRTSSQIPLFADAKATTANDLIETTLRDGGSLFRQPDDLSIEPVGHWLRAQNWRWGQQHAYTSDRTARSWGGDYEIWGFPLLIAGTQPGQIRNVVVHIGDEELYRRSEPLDSLTLILPASLGKPYAVSINGKAAQTLNVAMKPIIIGKPVDEVAPVTLDFTGVTAQMPAPFSFSQDKEWAADTAALNQPGTNDDKAFAIESVGNVAGWQAIREVTAAVRPMTGLQRHVNAEVPRSGVEVVISAMSAGMSGGLKTAADHITRFSGDDAAYAEHLASVGFDRVFETLDETMNPLQMARWRAELRARGVRLGANLAGYSHQGQLGAPNIAFFAACLPDWGDNLLRDLHLAAQRAGGADGGGFFMGADNAGYVPYWDWAPPIPNRPWARAFLAFQGDQPATHPIGPECGSPKAHERRASQREFVEYIQRYDQTWGNYGRFSQALADIAPDLPFTIGSFGSSPGVGGHGGWPWASVPAGPIFAGFKVQTAYDWNELEGTKPLHNLALVDRLRSVAPERPTWSIVDDFVLCHGPQQLQRDWAVSLSRGLVGIGTNFLAHTTGIDGQKALIAKRQAQVDGYRAAAQFAHRLGGAYAQMQADATVGIVYSDAQAISRHVDAKDPSGPHEGKTTEALVLCTLAGWPARIVTVAELRRGLDPNLKALVLVGLNRFDDTWVWYQGIEKSLGAFVARGGRILRDHESVCPVDSIATGMQVRSYIVQGSPDQLPWLRERNRALAPVLTQHLAGIPRGLATSSDDRVWLFPSRAGDCRFVTVANFAPAPLNGAQPPAMHVADEAQAVLKEFRNAASEVAPLRPRLTWADGVQVWDLSTTAPVDVRGELDLATTAVRVLVIPAKPPSTPRLRLDTKITGELTLQVDMVGCRGLPIEITVRPASNNAASELATVWGAAGQAVPLPLKADDAGTWSITARELASGLATTIQVTHAQPAPPIVSPITVRRVGERGLTSFATRRDQALVIALTKTQAADPLYVAMAERLRVHFSKAGRTVRVGRADPTDVVLYQQPLEPLMRYPRWQTTDVDLILLGTPRDQVLLLDQARGRLLPDGPEPMLVHTWSPFRGMCAVINVIGGNAAALNTAIDDLLALTPKKR